MVKDHSDSGRVRGVIIIYIISVRRIHTTVFVSPVVEHWLEREISQWVHLADVLPLCFISRRAQNIYGCVASDIR